MEKIIRGMSLWLAVLSASAIVIMVIAIAIDVVVRNFTGASMPGMIEIAETSLLVSVFFGLALAGVRGEHVAVTLVTERLNGIWAKIVNVFVWTVSSAFLLWMLYATTLRAIDSTQMREERFGLVRWPMYPMRWIVVIGVGALLLVSLWNLMRSVINKQPMGPVNDLEAVLTSETHLTELTESTRQVSAQDQRDRTTLIPSHTGEK